LRRPSATGYRRAAEAISWPGTSRVPPHAPAPTRKPPGPSRDLARPFTPRAAARTDRTVQGGHRHQAPPDRPIAALAAVTFSLAACSGEYGIAGASNDKPAAAPAPASASPATPAAPAVPAGKPKTLTVSQVDGFSPLVTNEKGRTIYRFDNDSNNPAKRTCFGACTVTWEPVLAGSAIRIADPAIDQGLVGTIDRPEGKQVTLNGWPLYYFKTDKTLGQTEDHGKNATWFAISPNGKKAQKTGGESATGNSNSNTGGYGY